MNLILSLKIVPMPHFSVQDLQSMAVAVTSDFYNHGTPLSVGLAKQASERNLNSDQIKRAVEATNTLAYLKSVESDRTGEFPLADYNEILKCASMPDDMTTIEKTAPSAVPVEDPIKQAAFDQYEAPDLSKQAQMKFLVKEAAINKRALEDAQARAFHLTLDLEKAASELKNSPHAVEALSLTSKDVQFTKLARLTFGTEDTPERLDWVTEVKTPLSWKPAMEKAAQLSAMLVQAEETVAEINHRSGLDKQAGLITNMAAGVGRAARAVATAPFRYAGNKVAAGVSAGIDSAATKIQTGFAGTGMGKRMGVQPGELKPSTIQTFAKGRRTMAAGTLAAGVGLDAVSFRPHNDPSQNSNGDVWNALN